MNTATIKTTFLLSKYIKKYIKIHLNILLAYLPDNGQIVRNIYHRLIYELRRLLLRFKLIFQKYNVPDPEEIYWIHPNRIVYHTNYIKEGDPDFKDRVFDMIKDKGAIYGGNWDITTHKFSELDVFKAFEQRIKYGVRWEETAFYNNELNQIRAGRMTWGCENAKDWNERCQYLDALIQSIKEQGYRLAHQVSVIGGAIAPFLRKEMSLEITVNIGRNGQYFFQASRHRLAIAKILGLKTIPVKVLVRHKEWQKLRENLISMAKGSACVPNCHGMLYQPAIHPDLMDIPAAHTCEDRFLAIRNNLMIASGTILDVGANLGYFCHKLEDCGFTCYAVENNIQIAEIANRIRTAEGKKFKIIRGNILDPQIQNQIKEIDFDVLLALNALNIFHHFLKNESDFNNLKRFLAKLKVKMIFFEPHAYDEEQMIDSHVNFRENEFIRFILRHARLNNFQLVHKANDGRQIYKLY